MSECQGRRSARGRGGQSGSKVPHSQMDGSGSVEAAGVSEQFVVSLLCWQGWDGALSRTAVLESGNVGMSGIEGGVRAKAGRQGRSRDGDARYVRAQRQKWEDHI